MRQAFFVVCPHTTAWLCKERMGLTQIVRLRLQYK